MCCVVLGKLGESTIPFWQRKMGVWLFKRHQHFKGAWPKTGWTEGCSEDFSQTHPRIFPSPGRCVSHRAAGPGSTLRAQSRGQGQLSFLSFCPSVSCSQGQTQAPQRTPQPKAWPDVRGDQRERKPFEAARRRSWVHGTAARQAHMPVTGSRSGRTKQPAVPWWRLPGSCRRLVKPCSSHSPAARQVSPTGAWEHQPRQTQTGVQGRRLPWKGKSRTATGDSWLRAVTFSTNVH